MIALEGYKILRELYDSPRSQVYQGYREFDRQPVVLKLLGQEYPSPEAIARFKLEYASFAANACSSHCYFCGQDLLEVDKHLATYVEAIQKFKKKPVFDLIQMYRQAIANLQGKNTNPCELVGDFYDATKMLPLHIETNYRTATFTVFHHPIYSEFG